MKRHYDLDVAIENAKIGEGKKSVSVQLLKFLFVNHKITAGPSAHCLLPLQIQ